MATYLLELELNGSTFHGTQVQAKDRTVQGVVEAALSHLNGAPVCFRPGSRLDQGVHAWALPGSCTLLREWDPVVLGLAVNQHLPPDVVVRRVANVREDFDCLRADCTKTYHYTVYERSVRTVLMDQCWWVRDVADPTCLDRLAGLIPGRHDLSGFACLRHDGTDDKDPVRTYLSAMWTHTPVGDGVLHHFTIRGRGFLYKQVRGLVGAMVHVAQERTPIDAFYAAIAQGRQAERVGNIAPAAGLTLTAVVFDEPVTWVVVDIRNKIHATPAGKPPASSNLTE